MGEESVAAKQDVSKEDKNRMLLSKSTRDGIEMHKLHIIIHDITNYYSL